MSRNEFNGSRASIVKLHHTTSQYKMFTRTRFVSEGDVWFLSLLVHAARHPGGRDAHGSRSPGGCGAESDPGAGLGPRHGAAWSAGRAVLSADA